MGLLRRWLPGERGRGGEATMSCDGTSSTTRHRLSGTATKHKRSDESWPFRHPNKLRGKQNCTLKKGSKTQQMRGTACTPSGSHAACPAGTTTTAAPLASDALRCATWAGWLATAAHDVPPSVQPTRHAEGAINHAIQTWRPPAVFHVSHRFAIRLVEQ